MAGLAARLVRLEENAAAGAGEAAAQRRLRRKLRRVTAAQLYEAVRVASQLW